MSCRAANDSDAADQVQWDKNFVVGSTVDTLVHDLKDYGVVFDFPAHGDVLGLAATHQVRQLHQQATSVVDISRYQ